MNKEIVKKEEVKIRKGYSPQEMRTEILPCLKSVFEPNSILGQLDSKLSLSHGEGIDSSKFSTDEEIQKLLRDSMMISGLDNHHPLIMAAKEDYRPLAIEFANNLAKEYECKTPSEKALSQVIVNSYIKVMETSMRFNDSANAGEYITENRTKYLAMLSKQMDRANRQFLSALTTLKQIKSPQLQINVKTNTAFIAQNQQLNGNPNENNKP